MAMTVLVVKTVGGAPPAGVVVAVLVAGPVSPQ